MLIAITTNSGENIKRVVKKLPENLFKAPFSAQSLNLVMNKEKI